MKKFVLPVLALAFVTSACQQKPAAPVSEAEANTVLDTAKAAWASMDGAKMDLLYADNVTNIDVGAPGLNEGKDAVHKLNASFASMKFDKADFNPSKIVPLGADTFIAMGIAHFTSSTGKVKQADIRFSEVFRKQADGSWKIVHEHISFPPKPEGA